MDRQSLFIYLLTAVIVGLGATAMAGSGRLTEALYSPGPLHAKHADAPCATCHQPFKGVTGEGCLGGNCHSRAEIEKKAEKPFVAELHKQPAAGDCAACHPDHLGPAAKLTVAFHRGGAAAAGFAARAEDCTLCHGAEGERAHPEIADRRCAACHPSTRSWKVVRFDHRSPSVAGQPCADCHRLPQRDLHAGLDRVKAARCDYCHGTGRWRPADFDHALVTEQARQACQNCHLGAGRRAHAAIRSTRCAACHTSTRDWGVVSFSHGEAAGEACTACHSGPRDWFHRELGGMNCANCHSTKRWEPSTFRHPRIPEMGEHMEEVGCRGCHPSSWQRARSCASCHRGGRYED